MNDDDKAHLDSLLRHIEKVRAGCELLASRLDGTEDDEFVIALLRNSMNHDVSKFVGIEWKYLRRPLYETSEFKEALEHHHSMNEHHPEYWGSDGISEMPRIFIAEMVCDWYARSQEMGTDLRSFIKNTVSKKYDMSLQGKVYKQVKFFVDILLDPEFKPIPKEPVAVKAEKENG